ncbi:uncharacterized protein LOC121955060 isoform X2 [Plectropomus leopardus]|uniref:uncharacterized protein LOC121955060 isoform X2 n=1 Tax=Plectropomus leopardus TaxID=160734 RepID=UPI001C4A982C|nr:uncharacterized protein LOC121955060 isoform X2 [Plectropomus leopardus]
MEGHLLFVILMYSFQKIQVQALPQPKLEVNSAMITETDSVTLNCQSPSDVPVFQCYFYTVRQDSTKIFSCMKTLTGSELLTMAKQSSPAEVKVKCFYTVKYEAVNSPSPHSEASSITIHRPKPQMSAQHYDGDTIIFTCSFPPSANLDTRCNLYFGEASSPVVTENIWMTMSSKNRWFCQFTVKIDDFQRHLLFLQRRDASCDYSVGTGPNSLSLRSDRYSLTDIVEKERSMASRRSFSTITSDLTESRPGASTARVKSVTDLVKKESRMTQSLQISTMTTGQTKRLHVSTPVPPTKEKSGVIVTRSKNSGSFTSTSRTPVQPESGDTNTQKVFIIGQTLHTPSTDSSLFPATPTNPGSGASETWKWKLVVAVACFGGVILLGLALLCTKRRTERCLKNRTQANVTGNVQVK